MHEKRLYKWYTHIHVHVPAHSHHFYQVKLLFYEQYKDV